MNLKYKIVEVWPNDHLIVVRYYTDKLKEKELASFPEMRDDGSPVRCRTDVSISLPIPEPTPDEIDNIIMANAPLESLKRLEMVKDPKIDTTMPSSMALLNKEKKKKVTIEEKKVFIEPITDEEIEKQVAALKKP